MTRIHVVLFFLLCGLGLNAQTAVVEGLLVDKQTNLPLAFATLQVKDSDQGTVADSSGYFRLELEPGLYNLTGSYTGYQSLIKYEIQLGSAKPLFLKFELEPVAADLQQVTIAAEAYKSTTESPLSLHKVGVYELERLPGATLDVSKYVKTLPGVSPRVSFGYNMIVRGGASNENRFFLDGIEIPAITHFNVQGTSGGPNGLLNVRMLQSAELHTGAFPSNRGNALSSVLEVHQREGRKDKFGGNFTLGATDWGFMLEGPMGKKSSYMFSARESFSQHMLKALGVPVLPTYSDVQYKQVFRFNPRNELIITGIGSYDKYELNLDAEASESLLYNVGYIPEGKQFLYAGGAVFKHYNENSYWTFVLSRNYFNNQAEKYLGNTYDAEDLVLDYHSVETETKMRAEHKVFWENGELDYGLSMEYDQISTDNFSLYTNPQGQVEEINYANAYNFLRYAGHLSYAHHLLDDKLDLFIGLRMDANTLGTQMMNPLDQLSPRLAVSYAFANDWSVNASAGIYYQLPPYSLLSYEVENELVNHSNLEYMRSKQLGLGIEHQTRNGYQFRLEGFYKDYDQYPFLLNDSISLANANANYVLIGNQPAAANSEGQAYGIEFQVKQKFRKSLFWSVSYSWVVSQFEDKEGALVSSSWDNRHFGTIAIGKTFKKNWQIGLRWSASGGNPYTPYDIALSSQRDIWNVNQRGLPDYNRLNQASLPWFHQLDFRVDKQFNFKKWSLALFLDIQNVYRSPISLLPYLTVERDENLNPVVDPNDSDRFLVKEISSDTGRLIPAIGVMVDW
ncbi:MAG: TonB-dependent receptor [Bacteroidetes bacterium]|nr:TonB-dependent receptor [Bacteroidota bacterium]